MLIVYASRTNNIARIISRLELLPQDLLDISNGYEGGAICRPFVIFTYTDLLGSVPDVVSSFLEKNSSFLRGVAGSGNRNFGGNFCGAAKEISRRYKVPLLATFELAGNEREIEEFGRSLAQLKE